VHPWDNRKAVGRQWPEAGARERPLFHRDRRQLDSLSAAMQVTLPVCSVGNYADQDLSIARVDSDQLVASDRPPPASPGPRHHCADARIGRRLWVCKSVAFTGWIR
jgi:hypothetical protein